MRRVLPFVFALAAAFALSGPASAFVSLDGRSAPPAWVEHPDQSFTIADVRGPVVVHDAPNGSIVTHFGSTTEFGSPRALSVVARRGQWIGVTAPELGNNRLGWIEAGTAAVRYRSTHLELVVDLSARTLELRRGDLTLRRTTVGIGRAGSETPTGRFAVTDKLNGPSYNAYYGCCILALSATQPRLPAGWSGGNRIAIHGTPNARDFGRAVSAGCVHAPDADLRYLMRTAPLGTPVVIRP